MYKGKPILSGERCAGHTYLAITGPMKISDSTRSKIREIVAEYMKKGIITDSSEAVLRPSYGYIYPDGLLSLDLQLAIFFHKDTGLDEFLESVCPKNGTEDYERGRYFRWVKRPEVLVPDDIDKMKKLFEDFGSIPPDVKVTIYTNLPVNYYNGLPAREISKYKTIIMKPRLPSPDAEFGPIIGHEEQMRKIEKELQWLEEHKGILED